MPAGNSERRCLTTARTAPSSSVSAPAESAAYRTQNLRDDMRSGRGANTVPADASASAVPASDAAASSTGTPGVGGQ